MDDKIITKILDMLKERGCSECIFENLCKLKVWNNKTYCEDLKEQIKQ